MRRLLANISMKASSGKAKRYTFQLRSANLTKIGKFDGLHDSMLTCVPNYVYRNEKTIVELDTD